VTRFKIGAITDEPLSAIFTWLLENADDAWSASIGNDQDNPRRFWINTDRKKLVLLFKMRWR